jgi:quinol monooxygenase YgiN
MNGYTFGMNSSRSALAGMVLFGLTLFSSAVVRKAPAQTPGSNVYVVIHVDIAGTPAMVADATRLLRELSADSRKDPGVVRFELLIQDGRLNHFTIVEVWQTREAFEAHAAAEHTKRFREKIQPLLGSPFDERLHALVP